MTMNDEKTVSVALKSQLSLESVLLVESEDADQTMQIEMYRTRHSVKYGSHIIQWTLVISTSLILNNRLSRR